MSGGNIVHLTALQLFDSFGNFEIFAYKIRLTKSLEEILIILQFHAKEYQPFLL